MDEVAVFGQLADVDFFIGIGLIFDFTDDFFENIFNLEAMADFGTISPKDLDLFRVVDSVDEAFDWLTSELQSAEG